MAEEDENRGVNMDADQQMDATILKLAEQYKDSLDRSAEENEERKTIRDNAEKLGIKSKAFQNGVSIVKMMSKGERTDYMRGFRRILDVLGEKQKELFPEDAERIERRLERQRAEAAKAKAEAKSSAADSDKNPRSDPARGGAGKKPGKSGSSPAAAVKAGATASDAVLAEQIAKREAAEQAEGAAVFERELTH